MLSNVICIFTIQFVQMGLYKIEYPHFTSFASTTYEESPGLYKVSLVYVWDFLKNCLICTYYPGC